MHKYRNIIFLFLLSRIGCAFGATAPTFYAHYAQIVKDTCASERLSIVKITKKGREVIFTEKFYRDSKLVKLVEYNSGDIWRVSEFNYSTEGFLVAEYITEAPISMHRADTIVYLYKDNLLISSNRISSIPDSKNCSVSYKFDKAGRIIEEKVFVDSISFCTQTHIYAQENGFDREVLVYYDNLNENKSADTIQCILFDKSLNVSHITNFESGIISGVQVEQFNDGGQIIKRYSSFLEYSGELNTIITIYHYENNLLQKRELVKLTQGSEKEEPFFIYKYD